MLGVALGIALADAPEAAAAGLGGFLGGVGALELVRGALGRGGTPLATALLVLGGAVVVAGLAFVPIVGYVELVAVPALGMRLRTSREALRGSPHARPGLGRVRRSSS